MLNIFRDDYNNLYSFLKKKPVISTKRFKYMSKVGYLKLIKYKRLACLTA